MNSNNFYCVMALLVSSCSVLGSEIELKQTVQDYVARKAEKSDILALVELVNSQASKDSDKIVIVPEQFRQKYVEDAVHSGRLFVILAGSKIIGYKKLYRIIDDKEREDILKNELRCVATNCALRGSIATDTLKFQHASAHNLAQSSDAQIYLYNGADFTHPEYRAKGVNGQLTHYALNTLVKDTAKCVKGLNGAQIALVYGLTKENAGTEKDPLSGRTKSIINCFLPFVQSVGKQSNCLPSSLNLSLHHAFKPSFDPKATECRPLSDDKSIAGYGCLLVSTLSPEKVVDTSKQGVLS